MAENPHFRELLQLLNDFEVRYLVVGGYAIMKYTEPRYTKDLDVWVYDSTENSALLRAGGTGKVYRARDAFVTERSLSRVCPSSLPMIPMGWSSLFFARWTIQINSSFLTLALVVESTTSFRSFAGG